MKITVRERAALRRLLGGSTNREFRIRMRQLSPDEQARLVRKVSS